VDREGSAEYIRAEETFNEHQNAFYDAHSPVNAVFVVAYL
jgi:hypothetical protein